MGNGGEGVQLQAFRKQTSFLLGAKGGETADET